MESCQYCPKHCNYCIKKGHPLDNSDCSDYEIEIVKCILCYNDTCNCHAIEEESEEYLSKNCCRYYNLNMKPNKK